MTYSEINTMIQSVGIPTAYYQFPENTGQEPPFICFYFTGDNDLHADNINYSGIAHLVIEVYTDNKDFDIESTVEGVLTSAGLSYAKAEGYIDTEKMFMQTYETEVLINGEQS